MKPIRVYIKKKYLLGFRIVMLIVALPFLGDAYNAIITGEILTNRGNLRVLDETSTSNFAYYAALGKEVIFSLFFLWLATFGSKKKLETNNKEE